MTNTRELILKLREVREEKNLSYNDILKLMEKNHDYLSKATLSKVFTGSLDDLSLKYETTLRPIAKALLDIETIEDDDGLDLQAIKVLLKFKMQSIEDLEKQIEDLETALDKEKIKYHEKLDKERALFNDRIDFLKDQISLKDKRIDQLLDAVFKKDCQLQKLMEEKN